MSVVGRWAGVLGLAVALSATGCGSTHTARSSATTRSGVSTTVATVGVRSSTLPGDAYAFVKQGSDAFQAGALVLMGIQGCFTHAGYGGSVEGWRVEYLKDRVYRVYLFKDVQRAGKVIGADASHRVAIDVEVGAGTMKTVDFESGSILKNSGCN